MPIIEPDMLVLEAGEVTLGVPACPADARVVHRWPAGVEVSVPSFRIARHPVTVREFGAFVEATGYDGPPQMRERRFSGPEQPALGLSWHDAAAYARWLADQTRRPYRLPRDAEWEKAARGGLEGKLYPWGDELPEGRCRFGVGEEGQPAPVGSYAPNGYGLYDMAGNIWQWCEERYADTVARDPPVSAPTGLPPDSNRVLRGGSFMTGDAVYLRCASRHEDPPELRHPCLGMRLAMDA